MKSEVGISRNDVCERRGGKWEGPKRSESRSQCEPRHYVYRMDHDTGFAPRVYSDFCFLCGCKSTTVELWAQHGSWIVGIGGLGTGNPDRLIYAMRVAATPTLQEFARQHPDAARYHVRSGILQGAPVLVSRHFFYFGKNAVSLSARLRALQIDRHGSRRIASADIGILEDFLRRFGPGKHGEPNN